MPSSWPPREFPHLTRWNHTDTSPQSRRYNCIAWAADNSTRWWWPDPANIGYWPPNIPRVETVDTFVMAYALQGYVTCQDSTLEAGIEKIAVYGLHVGGVVYPTHAARQLVDGKWTSKLGNFEDITHDTLDCLNGPRYGFPVCFLSRPRRG